MNGLRRVSILLGVSLVLTLFLGGMTVLADEAGNVSGNSNPEPPVVEAPPETPGEPDGNGTPVTPAPAEPYLCGKDGIITGVNPEYTACWHRGESDGLGYSCCGWRRSGEGHWG